MAEISKIINLIDKFLEKKHLSKTTPVEISPILENYSLLKDSASRPGKPLRELLRKGKIPHAYQIGVNWFIPHSKGKSIKKVIDKKVEIGKVRARKVLTTGHKLEPIGELIINLIEKKYKKKPICYYEYKPDWLLTYPKSEIVEKYSELTKLYEKLTENKFSLKEQLAKLTEKKLMQRQSFDIWIGEPFNFAVEFDEKQHFNQFRKLTFMFYENFNVKFPKQLYSDLNENAEIKPGKSGFTKLSSIDPLFPEMLKGEKQDNRIRQRAFRDYLKDILPVDNQFNPTLRIPYHITNKSINNFTETELENVRKYIIENDLL